MSVDLQGVTSQKIVPFLISCVRISNPVFSSLCHVHDTRVEKMLVGIICEIEVGMNK
jgi:hypothetical protein